MRYAGYDDYETVNGKFGGMSIYVQGCHLHCHNCFNSETWDFNGGKEWTPKTEEKFLQLIDRPYIKRISLLGGDPLAKENLDGILNLLTEINQRFNTPKKTKTIWLYSGYKWEYFFDDRYLFHPQVDGDLSLYRNLRQQNISKKIIKQCDVFVDGEYMEELKNPSLAFRGSSNQRLIDVQKSIKKGEIVLWNV